VTLTLTFDLLTSKLVCELQLAWAIFRSNLGVIDLFVLESCQAQDRQTDGRTDEVQCIMRPSREEAALPSPIVIQEMSVPD